MLQMIPPESPTYFGSANYVTIDDLEGPVRPGDTVVCPFCQAKQDATSEEQVLRVLAQGCPACEPVSPALEALKTEAFVEGASCMFAAMLDAGIDALKAIEPKLSKDKSRALVAEMLLQ